MIFSRYGQRMVKTLIKGYLSGAGLVVACALLLIVVGLLVSWLPWLGYVFFVVFLFGFVALLNWIFPTAR